MRKKTFLNIVTVRQTPGGGGDPPWQTFLLLVYLFLSPPHLSKNVPGPIWLFFHREGGEKTSPLPFWGGENFCSQVAFSSHDWGGRGSLGAPPAKTPGVGSSSPCIGRGRNPPLFGFSEKRGFTSPFLGRVPLRALFPPPWLEPFPNPKLFFGVASPFLPPRGAVGEGFFFLVKQKRECVPLFFTTNRFSGRFWGGAPSGAWRKGKKLSAGVSGVLVCSERPFF